MKLRQLESILSEVDTFDEPSIDLEQIATPAHLAARMIYTAAESYDDILDKSIADFGCGPGILSIASSVMGGNNITGFDVDIDALNRFKANIEKIEIDNIDLVQCDISTLNIKAHFDTIIMNPPFGTRNTGIDTAFVEKGLEYGDVVYSLHKTSTRNHFIRLAEKNEVKIEVIAELRYDIPKLFNFHKKKSKDIEVDLYRWSRR